MHDLKHWSLSINFVAWYVLTVVHPDITTVSIRDWQRVYEGSMIKPKINMWCMNFIERQGMVSFKVFLVKCMMHEELFKIHRMPDFFITKKCSLLLTYFLSLANVFLDSLSTGVEPKKLSAEVVFYSLGLIGLKQE